MRIRCAGFTVIELITVMVIIAVLAVVAVPRFFSRPGFEARSSYDQTIAALRYAQKSAIAQRRQVCVTFTATTISLNIASTFGGACDTALQGPEGTAGAYTLTGLAFVGTPANFNFNPQGQPTVASAIQISPISEGFTVTVELETGYVH